MGCDTAGIGWLLSRAFRGHPEIRLRSAVQKSNWIDYPHDLDWSGVDEAWALADVVHLHNSVRTWELMGADKPYVLHHHGTHYRQNAAALNRRVREDGGRAVVATLDLLDYGTRLTWVPAPFDLDRLAKFRRPRTGRLRVGHAPTDRTLKSTTAFLRACRKLDVEPVLIEGRTWAECLTIKGTCDVLFDQVQLGYGHNAIEAWGMGIPVIAGGSSSTLARMRETFGHLPFMQATEDTIRQSIAAMLDPNVRISWSAAGEGHVRRWHDGRETTARLSAVYASLA